MLAAAPPPLLMPLVTTATTSPLLMPLVTTATTSPPPANPAGPLTHAAKPTTGSGSGTPGAYEGQPSEAEVAAALDAASAAHARVDRQADQLTAARTALNGAAAAAGLALERYRSAVLGLQQAQTDADQAQELLQQTDRELRTRQEELGAWARQTYGTGGMLTRSPAMTTLLSGADFDDLDLTVVVLHHAGVAAGRALAQVDQAQAAQQAAADAADSAQQAASTLAVAAAAAREEANLAVTAQRAAVDRLQADLSGSQDTAADADARAARLTRARARADARARAWRNQVTGEIGACAGGDVSRYANGTIPLSALCPLWGVSGEYLRADASYAFGRLSQAYATTFSAPLCVTDSYRSYPDQVRVYAEKPELAAVPGTSNHGWGTAVDLCGGIESFGTLPHTWMLQNAPSFGWFHPSWAEPGGSRPEAWHWEFAG